MQLLPIATPLLRQGADLAALLKKQAQILPGDVIVVSSKVIATVEGSAIDLTTITAGGEAKELAVSTGRSEQFMEAVLQKIKEMNGSVRSTCPGAALTEVQPAGLPTGTILTANAGLDESNASPTTAIGWPKDPVASAKKLRDALGVPVVISDSSCVPRRSGVTAFALACAGIDPLRSEIGKNDLFGRPLHITTEAVADQLAVAANFLMGNANQSVPAVIIRDHGIPQSDFAGWVPGIEPEEDLFRGTLKE